MTDSLHDALKNLELSILDPQVRFSRERMNGLLAEDFIEFGQSGRIYTKNDVLELLKSETMWMYDVDDFHVRTLGADYAMVLYRLVRADEMGRHQGASYRCSIWRNVDNRWRMVFHQGTSIPADNSTERG